MKPFYFFLSVILFSIRSSYAQECASEAPSKLYVSGITSCSATLNWSPASGAAFYKVSYKKSGMNNWSAQNSVNDTFFTFTNLAAGTQYGFKVWSICNDGSKSIGKRKGATLLSCQLPFNISVSEDTIVRISFSTTCSFDAAYCRFGLTPGSMSTVIKTKYPEFHISGLQSNTTYYFQVSTCPIAQNNWSAIKSFHTITVSPNILLIILDDSRFDFYSCNGAPSFFQTPHIDRIANEGVNFKNSFVTHSLCAPSRATIATGMYTNHHGVFDNQNQASLNPDLPLLPAILKDNGYYTALIGKNHKIFDYEDNDFDYWMESTVIANDTAANYDYSGITKQIQGYDTDVISDSAAAVISRTNGPFFIWLAYNATHTPLSPAPEYKGVYDDLPMPLGPDTAKYSVNYPLCIYNLGKTYQATPEQADSLFFLTYEEMASVNDGIGKILNALNSTGKLNNTMIVFTSDNGHMLGEHHLDLKRVAYEQSLRVPLFIRYPAWFPESSVSNQFALNIDIAPSILKAAGISVNYEMDGMSLKELFNGDSTRESMYYHYWFSDEWGQLPDIFALRDTQYKYITYQCKNTTAEFFDLINDPLEMTNLINTSSYSSLVNTYKNKLTSLQNQIGDTLYDENKIGCRLVNPVVNREAENEGPGEINIFPNPADDILFINNPENQTVHFRLFNCFGEEICQRRLSGEQEQLLVKNLPEGIYYIRIEKEGIDFSSKLVVIH
ncbi:MAG: sulfatase-like hydrolase/transferase [Chitinophagales bacterium]